MKLFSHKDTRKEWVFGVEHTPNTDSKDKFKGRLVICRNGKESKLFFKSDKMDTVYFPIDKINEIQEISVRLKKNFLNIVWIDEENAKEFLFKSRLVSTSYLKKLLEYFLKEFKHIPHTFQENINGENQTSAENLFDLDLYDGESEIFNTKTILKNITTVITNYRIYHRDEKYQIIIDPIALPTDVIASSVSLVSKRALLNNDGSSNKSKEKIETLEIYYPNSKIYKELSNIRDSKNIERKVKMAGKRFIKESQSNSAQSNVTGYGDRINPQTGHGNISDIQKGENNSITQSNTVNINFKRIQKIIDSIRESQMKENLPNEEDNRLTVYVNDMESELGSKNPDRSTIKFLLEQIEKQIKIPAFQHIFTFAIEQISMALQES